MADTTTSGKPKRETAKERLARLQQQTAHNTATNAAEPEAAQPSSQAPGPAVIAAESADAGGATVLAHPVASTSSNEPAREPAVLPRGETASSATDNGEQSADRTEAESSTSTPAGSGVDSAPATETMSDGTGEASKELEKRPSGEVEGTADSVAGKFVTDDDLLLLTLQRPSNRNINVRVDEDLAAWFEDAVDELSYETRMNKTAITTIAFRLLRANWDEAVASKLLAAATAPRRRRRG